MKDCRISVPVIFLVIPSPAWSKNLWIDYILNPYKNTTALPWYCEPVELILTQRP
jgi:hypothetical protein